MAQVGCAAYRDRMAVGALHERIGDRFRSMVVLIDDHLLAHAATRAIPDPALELLSSRGIPVVLVSAQCRDDIQALQTRLGLVAPFIAWRGRELSVPPEYMKWIPEDLRSTRSDPLRLPDDGQSLDHAIQLLVTLFWRRRTDIVVGASDRTIEILRHADVPILVRNPLIDQALLQRQVPGAYYTTATGPAGLAEAILGAP